MVFSDRQQQQSIGSWDYKPFSALDVPIELNVEFLGNSENTKGVLSSKASGEPPMALGNACFFACAEAIRSFRAVEHGLSSSWFELSAPLTVDRIQTACMVRAADMSLGESF